MNSSQLNRVACSPVKNFQRKAFESSSPVSEICPSSCTQYPPARTIHMTLVDLLADSLLLLVDVDVDVIQNNSTALVRYQFSFVRLDLFFCTGRSLVFLVNINERAIFYHWRHCYLVTDLLELLDAFESLYLSFLFSLVNLRQEQRKRFFFYVMDAHRDEEMTQVCGLQSEISSIYWLIRLPENDVRIEQVK